MITRVLKKEALSPKDQERMFHLIRTYFHGVRWEAFCADLQDKNWIILIEKEDRELVGFSTIYHFYKTYRGAKYSVIYSGDTIVAPEARNSFSLSRNWIKTVKSIGQDDDADKTIWFLITSGYRTYRFLPVFWKNFYPRHDTTTPAEIADLVNHLARERFGCRYDPQTGIVKLENPQWLSEEDASVSSGKMKDPHIAFFDRVNPGHWQGDELVCFTELEDNNLTRAGRRMVGLP